MTIKKLYTVTKSEDDKGFDVVFSIHDTETDMLGDGEMFIRPGETFLDRWAFEDIKEGQYDENGDYLGEQWEEPD